jgi:hypothetical protein
MSLFAALNVKPDVPGNQPHVHLLLIASGEAPYAGANWITA